MLDFDEEEEKYLKEIDYDNPAIGDWELTPKGRKAARVLGPNYGWELLGEKAAGKREKLLKEVYGLNSQEIDALWVARYGDSSAHGAHFADIESEAVLRILDRKGFLKYRRARR